MDYLPVQATSVPCERVFSSAKDTDTAKRNRISPFLMEALQMLKYALKKKRLNFMEGWPIPKEALSRLVPDRGLDSLLLKDGLAAGKDNALDELLKEAVSYEET